MAPPPIHDHDDFIHSEEFLQRLTRRQLRLSIICSLAFLLVLLGLPLANFLFPDAMSTRVGGFTLSWLVLGVLFFPAVWCISTYFIRTSLRLETEEATLAATKNSQRKSHRSAP